ncbi:hypothetical protein [Amycolatopsis alkalitolerans]|uniref:Uncharacterized protein n=1 Tax=Amycolatopsis alkalitolerans TaxID=2547244 RepID=A0A5C4M0I7_9PSEU|nr:hypothetical protein [Amycolatopsis alkalitolerans]TNC24334.1 hypothetical protein FG385_18085 [Amycolatopsis alkalitolerans]
MPEDPVEPALLRELGSGLVDPEHPDGRECVRCGVPASLYAVDLLGTAWDTCPRHHGAVLLDLLHGKVDDVDTRLTGATLRLVGTPKRPD